MSHALELFSKAKSEAVVIFGDLHSLLESAVTCFQTTIAFDDNVEPIVHHLATVGNEQQLQQVELLRSKSLKIKESVSRDSMKVVFIGRTSSGKSTTINSMLHTRILPAGSGHTTNCFCIIKGTHEATPYLIAPRSEERRPISDVDQLADALSQSGRLDCNELIDLFWPTSTCVLLKNDVVLIDSPGLDISHDSDLWIDQHCTDADVFVLVSNFESSLSRTEVSFFERVVAKLSKPNIFVLFNRWDAFDEEESRGKDVPGQHMQSAEDFLVNGLQLQSKSSLAERVFFVSSKEALRRRSGTVGTFSEGMDMRYRYGCWMCLNFRSRVSLELFGTHLHFIYAHEITLGRNCNREFLKFEASFEECISKSAIATRFKKHIHSGEEVGTSLICLRSLVSPSLALTHIYTQTHSFSLSISDVFIDSWGMFPNLLTQHPGLRCADRELVQYGGASPVLCAKHRCRSGCPNSRPGPTRVQVT